MSRTPGLKASRKQESQVAADNGGKVNSGSGNGWRHKNDVRSEPYSFECKTTAHRSFSLKRDDLDTAERNALADGKDMVFVVDIDGRRYYLVRDYTWSMLRGD